MIEVNQSTIQEFIKLLIECGGTYILNEDHTIKNRITDQIINVASGKQQKPIMVFYEGAPCSQDVVWLNPFKENVGRSPAREWFFSMICANTGIITKYVFRKLVSDAIAKKDDNYKEYPLMTKIMSKVDNTTLDEIDKIGGSAFISINYNKSQKTATAESELLSQEIRDMFPKTRKKTWEVLSDIYENIFGTSESEICSYHAKLINIPETEAKLYVVISVIATIDPFSRDILNTDLHSQELQNHFEVLEGYSKLYEWASVNNVEAPRVQQQTVPPWNNQAGFNQMYAPQQPFTGQVMDNGQIKMSTYNGFAQPVTAGMYGMQPGMNPIGYPSDAATGLFGVPYR